MECTIDTLAATLEEYGVAIIPNVLNDEECDALFSGMWDFFEHITCAWERPIDRNDNHTWCEIYKLYLNHSMLVQHWNVGHSQAVWDVRQNEKCADVFAALWKCSRDDLLVSFDGCSFNVPPEVSNRGWNRNHTWYHTDQSFLRNEFECVQSWVSALDVNEGDATLSVFVNSHKYHGLCAEEFGIKDKPDWYKLTKDHEDFYLKNGCYIKNITCPKGSMVLWDSRTIHCGIEAMRTRSMPNFRSIVYLCYMPRSLCSAKNLEKRKKAFNELRMTTHYPCKPKLFPKMPQTYGGTLPEITQISMPLLSSFGKKLI